MPEQYLELNVKIETSDTTLLQNLFGAELPADGAEISLSPDITIKTQHVEVQHGLIETAIIVNCVVQVVSGIAIKILGDILADHLKNKKAKLTIQGKEVENITTPEIVSAIECVKDAE